MYSDKTVVHYNMVVPTPGDPGYSPGFNRYFLCIWPIISVERISHNILEMDPINSVERISLNKKLSDERVLERQCF